METKTSNCHYCYFGIQSKGPSNYHQIFQGITKAGAANDLIDLPVYCLSHGDTWHPMELAYANPIIHLTSFDDCNIDATSSFMFIRNATHCKILQFPTYPSFLSKTHTFQSFSLATKEQQPLESFFIKSNTFPFPPSV